MDKIVDSNIAIRDKILLNVKNSKAKTIGKFMHIFLSVIAFISILTTAGIIFILISDSARFFSKVPFIEIFSTKLAPLAEKPLFGIFPLIVGTIMTSLIAMLVAIPVGLSAAIYMSEFASDKIKRIIKPVMEILAGIPTIVYGFFAYSFVTPLLIKIIPTLDSKNALSPGIVMGIMIIPIVTSLSEDAMSSVPNSIRDGSLALGATRLETSIKVIMPAATSGIVASFVLAVSRAIGETMIVTIASGSSKNFTFDITKSMQTMTSYIVEFTSGDAGSGTVGYYSLYAVGLMLFIFTMLINLLAQHISRKFREEY